LLLPFDFSLWRDDTFQSLTTIDFFSIFQSFNTDKNGRRSSYSAHAQVHPQPPSCPQADGRVSFRLLPLTTTATALIRLLLLLCPNNR
jgi:hypothetical protein